MRSSVLREVADLASAVAADVDPVVKLAAVGLVLAAGVLGLYLARSRETVPGIHPGERLRAPRRYR